MRARWSILALALVAACTADARCNPSLSVSRRPEGRDGAAEVPAPCGREGPCEVLGVSAGPHHTCAVLADGAYCFGRNQAGQLGPHAPRVEVHPGPALWHASVSRVGAGALQNCAIVPEGSVAALVCAGTNVRGLLGPNLGDTSYHRALPVLARGGARAEVAFGAAHAVIHEPGAAPLAWGDNSLGQLGLGADVPYQTEPLLAARRLSPTIAADAGGTATCIVDGAEVLCMGVFPLTADALEGGVEEGDADVLGSTGRPWAVPGSFGGVRRLSLGMAHGCAIEGTERLRCWGANLAGESGPAEDGATVRAIALPPPILEVSAGGAHEVTVEMTARYHLDPPGAGPAHTCALVGEVAAPELYCWGDNRFGQLGAGPREGGPRPVQVPLLQPEQVSAGGQHTCAVAARELWCWGDNRYGQLGLDPRAVPFSRYPRRIDLSSCGEEGCE